MTMTDELEYRVVIGGVEYGADSIKEARISQEEPENDGLPVGASICAMLTMTFLPTESPPRMAEVRPYARGDGETEWTALGVFWIDQREYVEDGAMAITAYDAMMKAEKEWEPDADQEFPISMEEAARLIAADMGVSLDERCDFWVSQTIDYPTGYTMREVLEQIAVAHVGSWIMTDVGEMLLVPQFDSMPLETSYLVDQNGAAITLGGVRILIDEK